MIRELALPFPAGTPVPSAEQVEVQFWSSAGREDSWGEIGQTPWQGVWEKLPGTVERRDQQLQLTIIAADVPEFRKQTGVFKVRWLLPPSDKPYCVRRPVALSDSRWMTGEFCFEAAPRPAPGRLSIRAYNGLILAPGTNEPVEAFSWNAEQPLRLALRYCEPSQRKADRTLVRLESEQDSFSVAVEDVLASSAVYVRDFGVFVTRGDHPQRLCRI